MKKFNKQLYKRVTDVVDDGTTISVITQKYRIFNPHKMETTIFCETKIMEQGVDGSLGWIALEHNYHLKKSTNIELAFLHDSYVRKVRKIFIPDEGVYDA